ncbi:MAG: hypothetical protein R3B45_17060 [Bdellovibrionota bacterium]
MFKRMTIMLIPDNANDVRQLRIPVVLIRLLVLTVLICSTTIGYFVLDYIELQNYRQQNQALLSENNHLKGEAQILMDNLDEVKGSLRRIQDYSGKLTELVSLKATK